MAQGNIKDALQYASKNPTSDFAKQFANLAQTGKLDAQAKEFGIDLTPIKNFALSSQTKQATEGNQFKQEEPKGFLGKTANFLADIFGGKKLAQGAGMALASHEVLGSLDSARETLTKQQNDLIKQLKDAKASGKDTSQIKNALLSNSAEFTKISDAYSDFADATPTNKEVIGSAVKLAGSAGVGTLAKVASALTGASKATGIISGATRGLGAGAITGATEGAIQGAGTAAENNKSTEDIIKEGLLGGTVGGVLGGTVGAITGGISGGINKARTKAEDTLLDFVSPKLNAKQKTELIMQGKLKDPTLFKKAELEFTKRDKQLADSVNDVFNPKATISENIDAIKDKISHTNNGVRSYIARNKIPFNANQLRTQLNNGKNDLELIFASDQNAERTYDAVVNAFIKNVESKDTLGLFEARQSFDQLPAIKKLLESDRLGENARKEIVLNVRRAANTYISNQLPAGNQYKPVLLSESNMLEALGNIAEKAQSIIGKNQLQLATQKYPLLKWIIGGAASGAVGAAGVGVGSAIIGSTD